MNKYICLNRSDYAYDIEELLMDNKEKILNFFETEDNGNFNFTTYIYNTKQELYNNLKEKNIVTNKRSYQIGNKLYFYEPIDSLKEEYKNDILYEEISGIEYLIYGNHPKWLTNGIYMYIKNVDIKRVIEDSNINEFTEPYYSYIIVRYLIEKYTKRIFVRLISINDFIKSINRQEVISEAIKYYLLKYNIKIKLKH